jgi:hypothetical protein
MSRGVGRARGCHGCGKEVRGGNRTFCASCRLRRGRRPAGRPGRLVVCRRPASLEVHNVACASLGASEDWFSVRAKSVQELVCAIYDPDEFGFDPQGDWEGYVESLRLCPCIALPYVMP